MEAMTRRDEILARAEREVTQLADFFDLESKLNKMMNPNRVGYQSRDEAYDDWFTTRLIDLQSNCGYSDADAKTLESAEALLLQWLEPDKVKLITPMLALDHEMRLIKLFRLDSCRRRVKHLRKSEPQAVGVEH